MGNKSILMFNKINRQPGKRFVKNLLNFSIRENHYDIAIAGGGLVGTSMACAVGKCYILDLILNFP